jgi:hypothetical protein
MSQTISEFVTFNVEHCCDCFVAFAIPKELQEKRLRDGGSFYCPNGHGQSYTETENMRLRKSLEEKGRELTAAKCETLAERQKREAVEADLKRHERRTKNGICPCCKRTFVRLANHIAKAHPDYGPKQQRKLP